VTQIIPIIILAIEDDGDREFMTWLYIQYKTLLYSEIIKIVHDSNHTEDLIQDVIEKLIDRISLLRSLDNRGLVNYIITAAKHTAYNFCRDSKKEFVLFSEDQELLSDFSASIDEDLILKENLFCLSKVWHTLDEKTQYLLRAKYILNLSGKEIAAELEMPADNVRMALVRAKRKARKAMQEWYHQNSVSESV
jgi:RNA polymerase sigma-70 factor (ECF subfamily)